MTPRTDLDELSAALEAAVVAPDATHVVFRIDDIGALIREVGQLRAALAALRAQVEGLNHPAPNEPGCECAWRDDEGEIDVEADLVMCAKHERMLRPLRWDTLATLAIDMMAAVHQYSEFMDGLSGAAPAAGEVARIGFPGQPYGYATGGNEPAPAAPAAPGIDVERLAQAIQEATVFPDIKRDGFGFVAERIAAAYARLANPEKP